MPIYIPKLMASLLRSCLSKFMIPGPYEPDSLAPSASHIPSTIPLLLCASVIFASAPRVEASREVTSVMEVI